ncbi:sugar phosphate isomerase [Bacteroidia bacterium]|nr:sugar phosphate isomerase [Bacteroidia bacterium]
MQNRRDFLKQASLMLAGGLVVPQLLTSCGGGKKNIGLQLYSLREMVGKEGIQKVLETVAKIGYTAVETADYNDGKIYGLTPSEFKTRLSDLGLKCTSAHLSQAYTPETDAEVMAWWDKAIETHKELGVTLLIQPWINHDSETPLDYYKMYFDYFNAVGAKASAAGIIFGYHNHDFEFRKIDGKFIYDYMLDWVDKNNVTFELDVYWCGVGGGDPVAYLKNRPAQFKAIHIKDEKEIGASGKIDFKPIFDQMKVNNIKNWYVEVEQYTNNNPVASVQESYDFLAKADYVY